MITDTKATSARAFVRSLNILLKFTRLYGFDHARTATQFRTVWDELRAALTDNEAGLLLASSRSQLLLDGVPLGSSPGERSFAQLLSGAGLASIHFSPEVTQEDLSRLVRAFPAAAGSPNALAQQLKEALDGVSGIRLNEICFVPADSAAANLNTAVQLTARTLGSSPEGLQGWFNDPQKLLQLIAAAEGSKGGSGDSSGSGGGGGGAGPATAPTGGWAAAKASLPLGTKGAGSFGVPAPGAQFGSTGLFSPQEEDVRAIMRLVRQLGEASHHPEDATSGPIAFQQRLTALPLGTQSLFRQALASLAAQAPTDRPDQQMLLKLAQHLAIRFALDSYERGEVRVNTVRQLLDRMAREIEGLRGILSAQEKRMAAAGMTVEPFSDVLDRQFWAEVPEAKKHEVLSSPEAWCLPPRNIRQYVEGQLSGGESDVGDTLRNYASCVNREDANARRKTAIGLCELADLYSSADGSLPKETISLVGAQLSLERDPELQSLVGAAFVRLSQEAVTRRRYTALEQTLASLESVENQRPAFARTLRPRINLESHLPEFIEDALHAEHIPDGLADLMRLMPSPATEHLTGRFSRCGFREDCAVLIELAQELGPDGISHLRERFHSDPAAAVETIGLLSRLDMNTLEQGLPARLREWQRSLQDRAVRQLAAGGAPDRGRLLLAVFDTLDPLIRSLALDEIGMSSDLSTVPHLIRLAAEGVPSAGGAYLRLKAIEALGRLRAREAAQVLRRIVEAKQFWRWAHPSELRLAAAQALQKIDPDWLQDFLPRSGLDLAETSSLVPLDSDPQSSCVRQRRYPRLRLAQPLATVTTNLRENCRLEIQIMSLNGGLATSERFLAPGTSIALKINPGLRPVCAQAFVRNARARATGFEIADISLDDRGKLRRLLVELGGSPLAASPEDRSRRRRPGPMTKP